MIGTINIRCNAQHPNLPLDTIYSFLNSSSSVRIIEVPKKIGLWKITKVFFTINYPDNSNHSVECVLVGGAWVGTVIGSSQSGTSVNGFTINASGIDENGNPVENYILGKGDVVILETDGNITLGEETYYVHLVDNKDNPKKGNLYNNNGSLELYDGQTWLSLNNVSWNDIKNKPTTLSGYGITDGATKSELNNKQDILTSNDTINVGGVNAYAVTAEFTSTSMLYTSGLYINNSILSYNDETIKEEIANVKNYSLIDSPYGILEDCAINKVTMYVDDVQSPLQIEFPS